MNGFDLREEIGKLNTAEEQNLIGGTVILVDAIGFKRSYTIDKEDMPDGKFPSQITFPIRPRHRIYGENGYEIYLNDPKKEMRFTFRVYRRDGNEKSGQFRPIYYEVLE